MRSCLLCLLCSPVSWTVAFVSREPLVLGPGERDPFVPKSAASHELLGRALIKVGTDENAAPLLRALRGGMALNTVVFGSSVTADYAGCTDGITAACKGLCGGDCGGKPAQDGWVRSFLTSLSQGVLEGVQLSRNVSIRLYNAGMAGDSLSHFSDCLDSYMPVAMKVDLVVVELGVFRHGEGGSSLEAWLRNVLERPSPPTVVLLRGISSWACDNRAYQCHPRERPHGPDSVGYASARLFLEALAVHYGVALLDEFQVLSAVPHSAEQAKALAFYNFDHTPEDAKPFSVSRLVDVSIHPTPLGVKLYTDLLLHTAYTMLHTGLTRLIPHTLEESFHSRLPGWMAASSCPNCKTEGGSMLCHSCYSFAFDTEQGEFMGFSSPIPAAAIVERHGWEPSLDVSKNGHKKRGLTALLPGSRLEIELDTVPMEGGQPIIAVEFLASYEHMGVAKVECIKGCTCKATIIDALWERKSSERASQHMHVSAADNCVVRATLLNATTSREHKFKLIGIRVGEEHKHTADVYRSAAAEHAHQ